MAKTVDDLPDELLEFIVASLSPYKDLDSCKLVSRRWNYVVKRVVRRKLHNFYRAINSKHIFWQSEFNIKITNRYSHAACYLDNTMYVFGGCSSGYTTFNELLALDLTSRKLERIFTKGQLPSPKAAATMCPYKNKLILYGGMTYPARVTPYQPLILFNELHVFDTDSKTWTSHETPGMTPTFGHSATVHKNQMIIFGGSTGTYVYAESNTISCLDLDLLTWSIPECSARKPDNRFGQSQIYLDDDHLLIIGGCSKSSARVWTACEDAWLLHMCSVPWNWTQLKIENPQWAAPQLSSHPVTRVGDNLVAFSRSPEEEMNLVDPYPENNVEEPVHQVWNEENVNGRHGHFERNAPQAPQLRQPLGRFCAGMNSPRARRELQLAIIAKYEEKLLGAKPVNYLRHPSPSQRMNLYVADLTEVVSRNTLVWQHPRYSPGSPSDRTFYSLVLGNSELIMLGGQEKEMTEPNFLHFAVAPKLRL